ncbi:Retrovirus-related Pol polyprotein from transposon TNT 1-94 [Fusarium oxysporum]|uniref:Retrovirus-related Pol polyprotein from transposon TNT 1-94 n=1 Tax=Fusarium oxysporum TaxID=5507 RepID=A0A420MEA2_FUSOX|nr:Retrovirus-related Pol polyprotein from transposon TNT 1-94 [Fusarium oxysporum]
MSLPKESLNLMGSSSTIPKLEQTSQWLTWKREMLDLLDMCGYGDLLTRNTQPPTEGNDLVTQIEAWRSRQDRACGAIRSRLGYNARVFTTGILTAQGMMSHLESRYRPVGSAIFQELDRRFQELTLDSCDSVMEYANKLRQVRAELLEMDEICQIGEPHFVNKFLCGLGPDYEVFLTAFNQNHNILPIRDPNNRNVVLKEAVTFETAIFAASQEEDRQRSATAKIAHRAMMAQDTSCCGYCGRKGHDKSTCWKLHPELRRERSKAGYERRQRKMQNREKDREKTTDELESATYATPAYLQPDQARLALWQNDFQGHLGLIGSSFGPSGLQASLQARALERIHVLDSGASSHIFCRYENFTVLQKYHGLPINGIADAKVMPGGCGTYCLRVQGPKGSHNVTLDSALYVPEGHSNLLSVSALEKKGAEVVFRNGKAVVTNKGKVVLTATRISGVYVVDEVEEGHFQTALASFSVGDPRLHLWHERLAHLGERNIKRLMNMSTGIRPDDSTSNPCGACVQGKLRECPHIRPIKKGTYPLECIHADIAGPFSEVGVDGSRYWACFIDDFTQMSWVYPVKERSEFEECFQHLLKQFERPERRCHFLHLDRGGENRSHVLTRFCRDRGIKLSYTGTEQHEQNGLAEVLNRIILEKLTPTLLKSGLALKWWPYFLKAVNRIRNLCPTASISTTPYQAWYGDVPDLSHLRVLGSRGWALIPSSKRKKMQSKSIPCQLLGYQGSTNYILLDERGRVFVSNNVVFSENIKNIEPTLDNLTHQMSDQRPSQRRRVAREEDSYVENAIVLEPSPLPIVSRDANRSGETGRGETTPDEPLVGDTGWDPDQASTRSSIHVATDEREVSSEETEGHAESRLPERSTRGQLPSRYILASTNFAFLATVAEQLYLVARDIDQSEPRTFREATQGVHGKLWWGGLKDEHGSLAENGVWTLVTLPPGRKALRGKWVFKLKRGENGQVLRYKARFVVRGFEQREGIDFNETFASVVKPMSYKMIFAIAAALDLELEQMDVKTAFLYGLVTEEIYVEQPEGFDDGSGRVCKLLRALYGLKQAPRVWYETLSTFLATLGFKPLLSDMGVFVKGHTFIAVYVDDLLIAGPSKDEIVAVKQALCNKFKMTDLGPCKYYLGMSVRRDRTTRSIFLSQTTYLEKVLRDFGMDQCAPNATPVSTSKFGEPDSGYKATGELKEWYAKAIGSLMYLMLGTRPDIAFAVSLCSRHLGNPTNEHQTAVKRIFRYLKGSQNLELVYQGELQPLFGYTDSDWAGDLETRRSTSGYVFNLGTGAISWSSKRQRTVALSSCEAEYMGQTAAAKEAVWLRGLFQELLKEYREVPELKSTVIFGDNQGAIAMSKNPQFHTRTKHIDIQHHYCREKVNDGTVEFQYIPTGKQVADGLTKALPKDRFLLFRKALGLKERQP